MSDEKTRLVIMDNVIDRNSPLYEILSHNYDICDAGAGADESTGNNREQYTNDSDTLYLSNFSRLKTAEQNLTFKQYDMIFNVIGEGVCLCDVTGSLIWANPKYQSFPVNVQRRVENTCADAARYCSEQIGLDPEWSRKFDFQCGEDNYYEMLISPIAPSSDNNTPDSSRLLAIVWDNSHGHRLQQKLDAIDIAGSELVRIEAEAVSSFNAAQRLALLEDKIIKYTRDLMNFDHFNVYLLDKKTNRLQPLMLVGMPSHIVDYKLYSSTTGNGICGYVSATGKSYICHDVQNDIRYLPGLDNAASSLSVPLRLHDQVIGVFNVESNKPGNFTEDDRQFAEIFGRYIALALNILDLLIVERCTTSGTVAVNVIGEISQPLNDISALAKTLLDKVNLDTVAEKYINDILEHVESIRYKVQEVAKGPRSILGIQEALQNTAVDPQLAGRHILIADDEPNIIETIDAVLTRRGCHITKCDCGLSAITAIEQAQPDEFDLILSDISMADRNGYEVFATAKKLNPNIPVILMTGFGYDPHHSIVRASQEGLQCVLFKPFQVNHLLDEVIKAVTNTDKTR